MFKNKNILKFRPFLKQTKEVKEGAVIITFYDKTRIYLTSIYKNNINLFKN